MHGKIVGMSRGDGTRWGDSITPPKGWDNGVNPWEGGCQDVASMTGSRWADQKNNLGPVKIGTLTFSKSILISEDDCDYDFTVSH
ncbi:hypothetical protein D8674_013865 [Pyrus ussuriensis x Pyrus communis]|uniref:Uncharacterized protein n=1 Tax=Pyrus ussuriensis x Pyrus communis TaxID=2448454 RepID=A0A5N5GQW8_9ROSA|nr:hypothetical protein D8674_013865 [Pyrus ussuriensis x Pyrus communis]